MPVGWSTKFGWQCRRSEGHERVLSALAPASIAGRMKVEIFQAACNTLRTVAVRRRKWNLRYSAGTL